MMDVYKPEIAELLVLVEKAIRNPCAPLLTSMSFPFV